MSEHLNKFDRGGYFQTDGVKVPKTTHSHEHRYTLHNRLVLTQNQSPDICPTPINAHTPASEREIQYGGFGAMVTDFERVFNLGAIQIPQNELNKTPLRKLGKMYCPEWSTELEEEIPAMVDLEKKVCGDLAPHTKILGNGQITLDVDSVLFTQEMEALFGVDKEETVEPKVEPAQNDTAENQIGMDFVQDDDGGMKL